MPGAGRCQPPQTCPAPTACQPGLQPRRRSCRDEPAASQGTAGPASGAFRPAPCSCTKVMRINGLKLMTVLMMDSSQGTVEPVSGDVCPAPCATVARVKQSELIEALITESSQGAAARASLAFCPAACSFIQQ